MAMKSARAMVRSQSAPPSKAETTEVVQPQNANADGPQDNITCVRETITPRMAADWLRSNTRNRKMSADTVEAYARDMENGRWRFTGDAIRFDSSGRLIDGQHRLAACLLVSHSFDAMVIRGLPAEAQEVVDTHRSRRMSDVLTLRNVKNASRVAGAARMLYNLKDPAYHVGSRVSHSEILDVIERHPKLLDSVEACDGAMGISRPLLAAIHYVGKYILNEPEKADAFMRVFVQGIPGYHNDPAHAFREQNVRGFSGPIKRTPRVMIFSAIKAWNMFRLGTAVVKFQAAPKPTQIDGLHASQI